LVTNAETIRDLANRSDVKGIYLDAEQVMVAPLQAERTLAWGVEYIRADQAKQSTGDLRVAVIDTGVDLDHPGFEQGQVLSNLAKSFVSTEPTADDGHGHGTHCAGTIGSANYGVAPGVYIVPVKVLSKYGSGTWTAVMNGVEYGTQNANVCSMSLGGKASSSGNVVETAVKNGIAAGTVFVIAAGNSGSASGTIGTPGVVVEAITVGAISNNGVIAYFSSRGPTVYGDSKPDIVAPGVNVPSLWKNGGTNTISGTSMATPHVAGLCALILGKNDSLSPAQVKSILMQTAKGESGENVYGDGCIDALDALTNTLMARSQRSSDFTKTVVVTTDANGAVSKTVEIDAVMSVTMTHIQSDWSGTKNNFTNVTANLDKDTIFNGPVNNGQKYSVNKSVSSGKHTVVVTGEGGPANTEVTVTIYLSLW
jgi:subtilisin family serine protease